MKKPFILLIAVAILCTIIVSGIGIWKYTHYQYNALDLAIYTQVFWNTAHGDFLDSSIQNQNYFGDHIEPLIIPLSLLFWIIPSSATLIIVQAIILFASVLILFALARQFVSEKISLGIALAFAFNPIIWNMALFEFHMAVFAIPITFGVLYFLHKKNYPWYIISALGLLLVREDAAFLVLGVALYTLVKKKSLRWWLIPACGAIMWFGATQLIVSALNPDGFKFTAYYGWLGNSIGEILTTIATRPLYTLSGIITFENILLIISLVLLFLGLPLFKPKALVPAIFIFGLLLFGQFNPELLLETHYLALLLPILFYASILGIQNANSKLANAKLGLLFKQHALIGLIVGGILLYSFIFLGPLVGSIQNFANNNDVKKVHTMLGQIPKDASVASSYGTLPNLATRKHIFSLHYIALGNKQFSNEPYVASPEPEYVVLNLEDLTFYEFQYASLPYSKERYKTLYERLRTFLGSYTIVTTDGTSFLLKKNNSSDPSILDALIQKAPSSDIAQSEKNLGPVNVVAWNLLQGNEQNILSLTFQVVTEDPDSTKGYALDIHNAQSERLSMVPFGWNLYPMHSLEPGEVITMFIPIEKNPMPLDELQISLITREGYADLNAIRSASPIIASTETIGTTSVAL